MQYTHKKISRSRSLRITIKPNGEVLVTSPNYTPKKMVDIFVHNHKGWIETQLEKMKLQQTEVVMDFTKQILLFGEVHQVLVKLDLHNPIGIERKNNQLIVNPSEDTAKKISQMVERYAKSLARQHISERVEYWAKKMSITYKALAFKDQSSRWGSCSSLGNLNFNWRLIFAPIPVSDYVVIHELAHRKHMNHSIQFWKLVEEFDPEYRIHRGWLKRKAGQFHVQED